MKQRNSGISSVNSDLHVYLFHDWSNEYLLKKSLDSLYHFHEGVFLAFNTNEFCIRGVHALKGTSVRDSLMKLIDVIGLDIPFTIVDKYGSLRGTPPKQLEFIYDSNSNFHTVHEPVVLRKLLNNKGINHLAHYFSLYPEGMNNYYELDLVKK